MKHSALTPTLNPTGGPRGVDERRRNLADTSSLELAGALLQAHVVSDTTSHRRSSSADPHSKKPSTGPERSGTRRLGYSPPILSVVNPVPVQLSQQRVVGNSRRDGYEDEESSIRRNEREVPTRTIAGPTRAQIFTIDAHFAGRKMEKKMVETTLGPPFTIADQRLELVNSEYSERVGSPPFTIDSPTRGMRYRQQPPPFTVPY